MSQISELISFTEWLNKVNGFLKKKGYTVADPKFVRVEWHGLYMEGLLPIQAARHALLGGV